MMMLPPECSQKDRK